MKAIERQTATRGFTLIELLLTLALGAFVVATSVALYQYIKDAYIDSGKRLSATEKLIVSQRIFKEALAGSIESCNTAPVRQSLVNSSQVWLQARESVAEVYPAHSTIGGLKKIGNRIGEREATGDVLLLRPAVLPATSVVRHDVENDKFVVGNSIGLTRGGLAVVCDENAAVIFQVAYTTGRHIHYAGSGIAPGNCSSAFTSEQCGGNYRFDKNALLAHYSPSLFYVAHGHAGLALYRQKPIIFRQSHNRRLSIRARELVSGVVQLQATTNRTDAGNSSELVVQLTVVGNANTNHRYYEKHLYTLPL